MSDGNAQTKSVNLMGIEPSKVKSRYFWILDDLSKSLSENPPRPLRCSDLLKQSDISERRVYEVLSELENGGYIKKIEIDKQPYYILWKWGVLLIEAESINAIGLLEFMYNMEVR
jgi:hypothetical protein